MRVEACSCGGYIRAGSLKASASAVAEHNATLCHQIWRAVREHWYAPGPSTAVVTVVDLSDPRGASTVRGTP